MAMLAMKKSAILHPKFTCKNCDFTCSKKSDWDRHSQTIKHFGNVLAIKSAQKTPHWECFVCKKTYISTLQKIFDCIR
jgi:hypothetical protein